MTDSAATDLLDVLDDVVERDDRTDVARVAHLYSQAYSEACPKGYSKGYSDGYSEPCPKACPKTSPKGYSQRYSQGQTRTYSRGALTRATYSKGRSQGVLRLGSPCWLAPRLILLVGVLGGVVEGYSYPTLGGTRRVLLPGTVRGADGVL